MHNSCTFIFNINKKTFYQTFNADLLLCSAHLPALDVCLHFSLYVHFWNPFISVKPYVPYKWFITSSGLAKNLQLLLAPTLFLSLTPFSSLCLSLSQSACSSDLLLLHATLNLTCSHCLWHTHLYIYPSILQWLANYRSNLPFRGLF